jgi:hypothetical protein
MELMKGVCKLHPVEIRAIKSMETVGSDGDEHYHIQR